MFLESKEYYYDSKIRRYCTRKIIFNIDDISSIFEMKSAEIGKRVARVCLKTGRYHDIDASFDALIERVGNAEGRDLQGSGT